jgi:hypothetical protein
MNTLWTHWIPSEVTPRLLTVVRGEDPKARRRLSDFLLSSYLSEGCRDTRKSKSNLFSTKKYLDSGMDISTSHEFMSREFISSVVVCALNYYIVESRFSLYHELTPYLWCAKAWRIPTVILSIDSTNGKFSGRNYPRLDNMHNILPGYMDLLTDD